MSRVYIVTGANGHLGRNLIECLLKAEQEVHALILPGEQMPHFPNEYLMDVVEGNVCAVSYTHLFHRVIIVFFLSSLTLPKPIALARLMVLAPTLEVMMMMVLRKSTVWPVLSVKRPSSKTWSSRLKTSGCAFSISSSNTTEYGLRRTASVN